MVANRLTHVTELTHNQPKGNLPSHIYLHGFMNHCPLHNWPIQNLYYTKQQCSETTSAIHNFSNLQNGLSGLDRDFRKCYTCSYGPSIPRRQDQQSPTGGGGAFADSTDQSVSTETSGMVYKNLFYVSELLIFILINSLYAWLDFFLVLIKVNITNISTISDPVGETIALSGKQSHCRGGLSPSGNFMQSVGEILVFIYFLNILLLILLYYLIYIFFWFFPDGRHISSPTGGHCSKI